MYSQCIAKVSAQIPAAMIDSAPMELTKHRLPGITRPSKQLILQCKLFRTPFG
jgi:hypothetical protein